MSSEDILHSLFSTPALTVANRAWQAILVSFTHAFFVLLRDAVARFRVLEEKGVMHVTSGMRLRLEKRIEIPEGTLNPFVRRHLVKAH